MRINFDFGDLEAFLAVAEHGSFRAAAETVAISQSALSRRIQKLEEALGATLLERTTRSVKLTLVARSFRDRAEAMLEEAQEALGAIGDDTARFAFQRNQIVNVAAVPTATRSLLPRAIQAFRDQGFDGRIRINDLSANDVLEAVASGDADFGVNFIGGQEPSLDFHVLADDPFVLAVPRGGELDADGPVEWADVDPSQFIAVWKGSGNRMLIDNALAHARENVAWAYEVRHLSTALGLVEAGLGVTAVPASAMPGPEHPLLRSRPLINPVVTRTVGAVHRAGARLSPAAEAFYQIVIADASER
jgi:DNA-binding transcriptional LysR family regulator